MMGNLLKSVSCAIFCALAAATASAIERVIVSFDGADREYALSARPDGAKRLRIPVCDIARGTKNLYICADEFTADKGDEGYFIVPNLGYGNMGLFKYDNGKMLYDLQMSFWGVKSKKGTYVAIAKGLNLEAKIELEAVKGKHRLKTKYEISKIDFDPYEDIIIDYYKLGGENAGYVDMAKKYRQYQLERGEVVPLKERVKNNPELKYTVESPFIRIKMANNKHPKGMKGYNDARWDTVEHELNIMHSFDSFMEVMTKIRNAGVKEAVMCFVGWQVGGFDGYFPDLFPVEERLGGEAKMREAIKLGKSFGFRMTTHINNHNMYKRAKRWSEENVSKNRKGQPRVYCYWPGGQAYHTCFQTICDRYMDSDIAHLKSMGLNAPQHVDVTSAIRPSPCCDPLHPCNRKQTAQNQIRLGLKYREAFGGFTSEAGFDHVASVLDYALYTSRVYRSQRHKPNLAAKSLTEWDVLPVWQIVYHGIILSNPDWDTIDCYLKPKGHEWRLKFIECGGRPTFYWTDYKKQSDIDAIAEAYREYLPMRRLQYEFIDRHEKLAENVVLVGYSDGSEIIVNYSENPFSYKNKTVPARDFCLLAPR